ncbi:ribonuclease p protein subunit p40 [Anaeramoeba flamelloides]|uniref:Ribonuclease p protein subunit p40 n=1 Tax=Anaeramoeba flamelloides TaxID=1746091 RepID=A0ABQ8XIX7_9EUKA|nr:ribonuclease p protein subunit p40 [Anaeramoeba flamelloides]
MQGDIPPFPTSKLSVWVSQYQKTKERKPKKKIQSLINDHPFYQSIELHIFGNQKKFPTTSIPFMSNSFFYRFKTSLDVLTSKSFIDKYLANSSFSCLSISPIDRGDAFVILPNGKLILSCCQETYHQLGLIGKRSTLNKKPQKKTKKEERFSIEIDLLSESFKPKKKFYERVQWCFKNRTKQIECIAVSLKNGISIEMDLPKSEKIELKFSNSINTEQNVQIPKLGKELIHSISEQMNEESHYILNEFYEWMGFLSNGIYQTEIDEEFFQNDYQFLEFENEIKTKSNHCCLKWSGLLTPIHAMIIFEYARSLDCFVFMNLYGFRDTPISWINKEHGYFINGENDISFAIFPSSNWLWSFVSIGCKEEFN